MPEFKYNMSSVNKLCRDSNCIAVFHGDICLLQDYATRELKGLGEYKDGLYYLVNSPLENISPELLDIGDRVLNQLHIGYKGHNFFVGIANKQAEFAVWHKRLGHAPVSKLKYIPAISTSHSCKEVCLTCPMAKFAKLPYELSDLCK